MNGPGTMGPEWLAKEIALGDAHARHASACRDAFEGQDALGELMVEINRETIRHDPLFDYSGDGLREFAGLLAVLAFMLGAIAAAFVFS